MIGKEFTPLVKFYIIKKYEKGWRISDIAKYYHTSASKVSEFLKSAGYDTKKRKGNAVIVSKETEEKIVQEYVEGATFKELQMKHSLGFNVVRRIVHSHGCNTEDRQRRIIEYPYKTIKDYGKVGALWRAGWSVEKIADEFGATEEEVKKVLCQLGVI